MLHDENISQEEIHKALHNSGCAVRMLHRMAVTHGDLSTNNILIDEDCNAFLIDFGLSAVEYEVERFGIDLHVMDEILGHLTPILLMVLIFSWRGISNVIMTMVP